MTIKHSGLVARIWSWWFKVRSSKGWRPWSWILFKSFVGPISPWSWKTQEKASLKLKRHRRTHQKTLKEIYSSSLSLLISMSSLSPPLQPFLSMQRQNIFKFELNIEALPFWVWACFIQRHAEALPSFTQSRRASLSWASRNLSFPQWLNRPPISWSTAKKARSTAKKPAICC